MADVKGFQDTIDWYNGNAKSYSQKTKSNDPNIAIFTSLLKGKKILDAGCGPGHDTNKFAQLGYHPTGIDISTGLLREAKKSYPQLSFIEGNLLKLPFEKNSFDGVWSQASLLHLETVNDVKMALAEFYRVLKEGGVVYVFVKKQTGTQKTAVVTDSLSNHDRFFQYFTETEIQGYLTNIGFSVIRSEQQDDPNGRPEVKWIMVIGKK